MMAWRCFILLFMEDKVLYCKAGYSFICFCVSVNSALPDLCLIIGHSDTEWILLRATTLVQDKNRVTKIIQTKLNTLSLAGLKLKLLSLLKIYCKNHSFVTVASVLHLMSNYGIFLSKRVDVTMLSLQLNMSCCFLELVDYF